MSPAICFNLDQYKILSFGNGLRGVLSEQRSFNPSPDDKF